MTNPPEAPPDCAAVVDELLRRLKGVDVDSLRLALKMVQARLGTAAEQPCDLERVQALGHAINNRMTVIKLELGLRRLGIQPNSPPV